MADRATAHGETANRSVTHEEALAERLPPLETEQPDPVLQLSVGRLGAGSVTLAAIAAAAILAVVLYGLNTPAPSANDVHGPAGTPVAQASGGSPGGVAAPQAANSNSRR
jgi:hypothetical protein